MGPAASTAAAKHTSLQCSTCPSKQYPQQSVEAAGVFIHTQIDVTAVAHHQPLTSCLPHAFEQQPDMQHPTINTLVISF